MVGKCVFLDRDGVLNEDLGDYTYEVEKFSIVKGVPEALKLLHEADFMLIVITNQAGISRGRYSISQMQECHDYLQQQTGYLIQKFYFSPYHPTITESLSRKPGSLMFEKAIARFDVDVSQSWMIGDKKRDLEPAIRMGLKTIQVDGHDDGIADFVTGNLLGAAKHILS